MSTGWRDLDLIMLYSVIFMILGHYSAWFRVSSIWCRIGESIPALCNFELSGQLLICGPEDLITALNLPADVCGI